LLIVLATMLRVALGVACSRLIVSQGNAGTIVSLFGSIVVRNNYVLAILVFGVLAIVIFRTICKATKDIRMAATEFTADIIPIKQIHIDSDLNTGIINESKAFNLRSKIALEAGFFVAMAGAARFILCAAVIELVIVIVNIAASMAIGIAGGATGGISIKTYATLAVGAGTMTQIPALVAALASAYLVRKSSVSSGANDEVAEQAAEIIKVGGGVRAPFCDFLQGHPNETAGAQAQELEYGNTVNFAEPVEYIDAEITEITNPLAITNIETEKTVSEDLEWVDESQSIGNEDEKNDLSLWVWEEIKDSDYYEAIADLIASKSPNVTKTTLMAAESVEELPVTIPVNIAAHLAQRNQKCLLIDLDLKRGAISKVFDIDSGDGSNRVRGEAIATCINNLWVWAASNFEKDDGDTEVTNLKDMLARLESQYERLVVYAPNIKLLADRCRITDCVGAAILFGSKSKIASSSISDFHKLLISSGCEVLKPTEVFAGAV
ncbi:MAG: FHIPEP family type III secretion protein, partial [Planctomycetota bacterium]